MATALHADLKKKLLMLILLLWNVKMLERHVKYNHFEELDAESESIQKFSYKIHIGYDVKILFTK